MRNLFMPLLAFVAAILAAMQPLRAADFNWMRNKGESIRFLVNNNSLGQALIAKKALFEKTTGVEVKVDLYQEQQMRQRLLTIMNAGSDEIDVFMTLPSREGQQFAVAGWVSDLGPRLKTDVSPDYNSGDISKALLQATTFDGRVTSIPMNIEGPVLYWRTDIFKKCEVAAPARLDDILPAAQKIAKCDTSVTPFVSRGLKPALAYSFSNFLHNMGAQYMKDGKSNMCSPEARSALELYSTLLRDYGPPGVVNYSFQQISSLYSTGRAAMAFEASNQLTTFVENTARLQDTAVMPLPPGPNGSVPTTIGWGLALSPHSKKADAAWLFIQWATSPDLQKTMALEGIAPPREAVTASPEYRKWIDEQPVRVSWQKSLDELSRKGTSEVGYPIVANPESRDFIGQPVVDLLLKKKTVAEACADADRAMNELISRK